jgi:Protein of unknown function (DUF2752)
MGKKLNWLYLIFYVATPIIFLILPADYFDSGEALCPSKRFFDIECLGCGMTRAVMHLIHFDIDSALYFNALSFVVAPVLAFFWVKWTIQAAKDVGIWPWAKKVEPEL